MDTVNKRTDLRVCHLIQYFEVGGIERMVLSLATAAELHGVASTVVAYRTDGPFRQTFHARGVPTAFFPTGPGIQMGLSARLARFLRSGRFDVLHTHHVGPFIYGGPAALLAGVRHVHTEHSRELYDRPRRRAVGWLMPRIARVVCVSEELADWRTRHLGYRPKVVVNGVSVPAAVPNAASNGFVVSCIARLAPEKDHATLLRAFAQLRASVPNARLDLVGDGPERGRIESLIRQLGIADGVTLAGQVSNVGQWLERAHVVALSSTREGLPMALLEAMAYGRPVVATAVGGIPELLANGGGVGVPVGDHARFAAALADYANSPQRMAEDGERARELVVSSFSEAAMVADYCEIYRQVSR